MKLKIVGSGGMSIIPSSFCTCAICEEARQKGGRYERLGPSLYIEDIKMLIDTPEDIAVACNRQNITQVKHMSISHPDPDHVKGIRIVEKIGYDFIQEKATPIEFYALPEVVEEINRWNLDCLQYYIVIETSRFMSFKKMPKQKTRKRSSMPAVIPNHLHIMIYITMPMFLSSAWFPAMAY